MRCARNHTHATDGRQRALAVAGRQRTFGPRRDGPIGRGLRLSGGGARDSRFWVIRSRVRCARDARCRRAATCARVSRRSCRRARDHWGDSNSGAFLPRKACARARSARDDSRLNKRVRPRTTAHGPCLHACGGGDWMACGATCPARAQQCVRCRRGRQPIKRGPPPAGARVIWAGAALTHYVLYRCGWLFCARRRGHAGASEALASRPVNGRAAGRAARAIGSGAADRRAQFTLGSALNWASNYILARRHVSALLRVRPAHVSCA